MDTRVIVFDIDGTLADCKHRQHHVQGKRKNWPAFNAEMVNDKPHDDIIWLLQTLQSAAFANPFVEMVIVIASGRGSEDREVTEKWLADNGVTYQKLYMRKAKDNRKDSIVKREILDEIRKDFGEPFMVFDDRNQVVDMWRAEGIRCLQVAPGDF